MPFSTTVTLEFAEQAEDPGQGFDFDQVASWQAGLQQTGGFCQLHQRSRRADAAKLC